MKILITGASGQLGHALQAGFRNHILFPLTEKNCDITEPAQLKRAFSSIKPDLVINAAAYTNVDGAEADEKGAYKGNEEGPRLLALETVGLGIPLIHFSTDYVFDGKATSPYTESSPTNPQSVYGKSKLAGEKAIQKINPQHFIVRTAWLYHTQGHNFPKTMIGVSAKPEVRVVNDQIGCPTYAPHLVELLKQVMSLKEYGIYHLAGGGETSWHGMTVYLYEKMKIKTPVIAVSTSEFPRPAPRPAYSVLRSERQPKMELPHWKQGIDDFLLSLQAMRV